MEDTGDVTVYNLVVTDAISGRRNVLTDTPVVGRYQAEAEKRNRERNNRNPNLHYSLERSRRKPQVAEEELVPEALLTHKFRAR